MTKFLKFTFIAVISTLLMSGSFIGCTKKPSNEDVGKLQEAKTAAESAERKLSDLRTERMQLEKQLEGTQGEEQGEQKELDEVQNPDGESPQ